MLLGVNPPNFIVPPVEGIAGGGTGYGWTDGGAECSNFGRGIIDPTQIPSADLLQVWCMPSTANVGEQDMPRPFDHVIHSHYKYYFFEIYLEVYKGNVKVVSVNHHPHA